MPPLNLQVQTIFAKEFVQKLTRLNNSNPTLDHVKLFYKVLWVVGTLYHLGIGSWNLTLGCWDLGLRGCFQGGQ